VSVRGVGAVAWARLLQLGRSPVGAVIAVAFALLAATLADVASPSRVQQVRQGASWLASAASALLAVSALLLPVTGGAPGARLRESRIMGRVGADLGHGLAGLVFLAGLAAVLGGVATGWLALRFGDPDGRAEDVVVRNVLYRNADAFTLAPGESWRAGPFTRDAVTPALRIELAPRIRFVGSGAQETREHPSPAIEMSWRDDGRLKTRRILLADFRRHAEVIESPAGGGRAVELGLRLAASGIEAAFEPGDVTVLGVRSPLLPTLLRAFLAAACLASVVAVATQWFSNFVGPAVAVAAAVTIMIVAGALKAMGPTAVPILSGFLASMPDAAAGLRQGHAVGWSDVGRAFAIGAGSILLGSALTVRGPGPGTG
jgi:hypothetical protein